MSKKPDTASALAGIIKAKRSDDQRLAALRSRCVLSRKRRYPPPLPRCLLPLLPSKSAVHAQEGRGGKSSDRKLPAVQRLPPKGYSQEGRQGVG